MLKIGSDGIGGMYLGSDKIVKAYQGSDLVFDASGGDVTPQPTYVETNLVFHLDGINRGGTAGHWIDRINGVDFTLNGCTEFTDHVSFGGTGYGLTDSNLNFSLDNHTIELVIAPNFTTPSGSSVVFITSNQRNVAFAYTTSRINVQGGTQSGYAERNTFAITKPTSIVHFIISQGIGYSAYVNGSSISTGSTNYFTAGDKASIGCRMRNGSIANKFDGSIYAIRIYQGDLSAKQRFNNLLVDNSRYNMGLNYLDFIGNDEYIRLEYIQGITTSLDTGISAANSQWELDLVCDTLPTSAQMFIGTDSYYGHHASANGSGKWGLGSDVETSVDATTRSNIIIGFTSTGISMTIGNQTISRDRANSNHTNNVYLFGSNNNQFLFMGKIYSARCTSGGSFNGVPAQRISDGKKGIYDLANSVFYPLT